MAAPLYDPRFEHDACGLAAVVAARRAGVPRGRRARRSRALANLDHRGATGADPETGDGAGIMTQLPDRFLRGRLREELGHDLPRAGRLRGRDRLPAPRPGPAAALRGAVRPHLRRGGPRALGWRDVPVRSDRIGRLARACEPVVRQLFVERRSGDEAAFERKLYVIRRRVERAAAAAGVPEAEFTIVSLSARRLVYKGLLTRAAARRLLRRPGRARVREPRWRSSTAASRRTPSAPGISRTRSTSWRTTARSTPCAATGTGWPRASRSCARSSSATTCRSSSRSPRSGGRTRPSSTRRSSCSCSAGARWRTPWPCSSRPLDRPGTDADDDVRAFHEYHGALVEPWDGPAAIVATDGVQVVATLDRNGLRPLPVRAHPRRPPGRVVRGRRARHRPRRHRRGGAGRARPAARRRHVLGRIVGRSRGEAGARRGGAPTGRGSSSIEHGSATCRPGSRPAPRRPTTTGSCAAFGYTRRSSS